MAHFSFDPLIPETSSFVPKNWDDIRSVWSSKENPVLPETVDEVYFYDKRADGNMPIHIIIYKLNDEYCCTLHGDEDTGFDGATCRDQIVAVFAQKILITFAMFLYPPESVKDVLEKIIGVELINDESADTPEASDKYKENSLYGRF